MEWIEGRPLAGVWRQEAEGFLAGLGLRMEQNLEYTLLLAEKGEIAATGSRRGNVLQCVGVAPARQGEGVAATLVTALLKEAFAAGHHHLFVYTRPCNARLFGELGFFPVAQTEQAALLENRRGGAAAFAQALRSRGAPAGGHVGCIVANGNPFTNGHLYLAETAAAACDFLYFLVLSEDKSEFPASQRLVMAKEGLAHLANVQVCETGPYLISAATFPDYFIKDEAQASVVYYDLDIAVFGECFAPALDVATRFVGTEPRDLVTRGYNGRMKQLLPRYGVALREIPRKAEGNRPVSASTVRRLLREGVLEAVRPLVPPSTFRTLEEAARHEG